ncbi:MAG: glycosyltransferase family 2 protein [Bacteroidetes bacterium]|nr:glycosyltransferase family 2 protein [Bacteroidota bacterium]
MNPQILIVILTYNHLDETIITLNCFKKQVYDNFKIVVVDNASTDVTCDFIKKFFPDITLIENNENHGWAKGNNIGIKYALENGADYVLLANNDLYFEDSSLLSKLVNNIIGFSEKDNVRIIGTKQFSFFDKEKLQSNGIFYFNNNQKMNEKVNTYRNNNKTEFSENFKKVDSIIGAFILIKSNLFCEIGLIDDDYFFTWEDTDFCYRAWKNGFVCLVDEDLKIYHKVSTSCKKKSAFTTYYLVRNQYLFLKKHKKTIPHPTYFFLNYYYKFFRKIIGILIFPSELYDSRFKVLKAAFNGFFDAVLLHKTGKGY